MKEIITTFQSDGVATVTLNRPESHNAFNDSCIQALHKTFEELSQNPQVSIVVLKASGKSFSAGADLHWMERMASFTEEENFMDALKMADCFYTLATLPKPTIVVVQGSAYGGGVGLVAACDIAIAAENATFCFPEVKLGLIPAVISPYINQAIGKRAARRYYLTGEQFNARKAEQMGLVHSVVPYEKLEDETTGFLKKLSNCGPMAMAEVKSRLATYLQPSQQELVSNTARWIATIRGSAEGKEGISAFLEKRSPLWNRKR